jgi:hypothetical protein
VDKAEDKAEDNPEEEFSTLVAVRANPETKTTLGKRGRDPDDDGRLSAAESPEE